MALSLLNHFFWEIQEARIPFILADLAVIVSLHFIERGMKSEKKLRELEAAQKKSAEKETDKANAMAMKKDARAAQRAQAARSHNKASEKRNHNPVKNHINQPKKNS